MKVRWSKQAMESLVLIYDFIYKDSPQNAELVFNKLLDLGNTLSDPNVEYSMDLIINDKRFRFISKWSYKIIYERQNKEVLILDVFSVYQNPEKLLNL
ncbi:MAG TPA: type II toxin-antitoxin system RelE/ParE family toxin [Flavobacteriaceae bacterium]|nr:type II toxin-antitoxin system RelE/ParE family toxin [Flavobacteriaceae bacterium]